MATDVSVAIRMGIAYDVTIGGGCELFAFLMNDYGPQKRNSRSDS